MGYMEKRRHHKSQTTYGIIIFLILTFLSVIPFLSEKSWLFDGAGELRLYYIVVSFVLFLYFLYNKRWLFSFFAILIIISNIAFIYSSAGRPFKKAQTELEGESFSFLLYSQNKQDKELSDLIKIIADKSPNAVIAFNINSQATNFTELTEQFSYYKTITVEEGKEVTLLSNLDIVTGGDLEDKEGKIGLWSTFNVSDRPVTLIASEFLSPWSSQKSYYNVSRRIDSLAEFAKSRDEPIILTGVFKASSWSALLSPLKQKAELRPQEGIELGQPLYLPWFLRFSFYHIYAHLGINVENVEKIIDSNSDAVPLFVTVKVLKERIK